MRSNKGEFQMKNLFLLAHRDDEFGIYERMYMAIQAGEQVFVCYLTDTGKEKESLSVLKRLKVPKENIFFNRDIQKRTLQQHLDKALDFMKNILNKISPPDNLFFHAWEGGHQDLDAVHLLGIALGLYLNKIGSCYQFPLYRVSGKKMPYFNLFVPLPENGAPLYYQIPFSQRLRFLTFYFHYMSQVKTFIRLGPFILYHYLFKGTQILQPVCVERIQKPPHKGMLLYEKRGRDTYQKFEEDTRQFRESMRSFYKKAS